MSPMEVLQEIGLGVAGNAVFDVLKKYLGQTVPREQVKAEVENQLRLFGATMSADTVINALVKNGFLSIEGSMLHANEALAFGSTGPGGHAIVGNQSRLSTNRTAIEAGKGAYIQAKGNSQVRQNADGSISFHVGEGSGDSISFSVPQ